MIYTLICKQLYSPLLDRTKQSPFREALDEAVRNERRPLGELRSLQIDKLRRILGHASRHVPYYAAAFARAGLVPDDIRDVADLRRLPVLTKEEVFASGARMVSDRYVGRLFAASTSGSTGIAMRFHVDSGQYGWVEAMQWRGRRWWGIERGDPSVVLWSRPVARTRWTNARAWGVNRLRNTVQFDAFTDLDAAKAELIAGAIERHRPRLIYGYGSSLGKLADLLHTAGPRLSPGAKPNVVEYTADHMYAPERRTAAEVFGAPVISAYGSSECGGVAQQCREGRLHIAIDHVVVEFLRSDGSPTDEGETGRIVISHLNNLGMPLLRYEVGDMGAWVSEPCPCGVTLPCMSLQVGKSVDVIDTSEKRGVSAHVFDYINLHLMKLDVRGIKQFFVEQTGPDTFDVAFVREQPFEPRSVDIFVERMRAYLGSAIAVQTRFVEEIPLTASGKRRYFKKRIAVDREASGS